MAKANTASRVRKKVRKTVSEGIVHVHASLTIQLSQLQIVKEMRYLGLLLAVRVLRAHVKVHHLLLR